MTGDRPLVYTPDVSRGEWIRERLGAWATIASVVPRGFEAYARVLHPLDAQLLAWDGHTPTTVEDVRLRWRDITERHGTTWHPLMQWEAIIGDHRDPGFGEPGWQYGSPMQGNMDLAEFADVTKVLARHTQAPDACTAALWEGYGWVQGGQGFTWLMIADDVEPAEREELERENRRLAAEPVFPREVRNGPRLELPGRAYLLFDCDIRSFENLEWPRQSWGAQGGVWKQTPNQLWPEDHAWFLASEIDFDSTIVGGSRELVDALVACEAIEAVEIPAGASLTSDADTINRR